MMAFYPHMHQRISHRVCMLAEHARVDIVFETETMRKAVAFLANAVLICTIGQMRVDLSLRAHEHLDLVKSFLLCVGDKLPSEYLTSIAKALENVETTWQESKV